jgi:hypothetical protein
MNILLRLLAAAFVSAAVTSCCCFGGSDRDETDPGDITNPEHSEGRGDVV